MSRRRRPMPSVEALSATVELFSALANPLRLELLVALSRRGELAAGELQQIVGAEQSAVSHQLASLRRQRLAQSRRDGRRVIYSLADEHVAHIVEDAIKHANEPR